MMYFLALIAAAVGYLLFAAFLSKDDDILEERLAQLDTLIGNKSEGVASREQLNKPFYERVIRPVIQKIASIFSGKVKKTTKEEIQLMLLRAGNPGGLTANEFIAVKSVLAFGLPLLVIAFLKFVEIQRGVAFPPNKYIMWAAVTAIIGILGPRIFIQKKTQARQQQVIKQLPDVLDLLTVSIEAGLGFDLALQKVIEKMQGVLADEFAIVLKQINLGKPRSEALRAMADRLGVEDLSTFVTALIQAEKLGVSLGKVLRIQSDQMRLKRKQRAEEAAMKAPVKMMLPLVGCIFPVVFIVLMGGAAIKLYVALLKK
jgi:tight adherence protein C